MLMTPRLSLDIFEQGLHSTMMYKTWLIILPKVSKAFHTTIPIIQAN